MFKLMVSFVNPYCDLVEYDGIEYETHEQVEKALDEAIDWCDKHPERGIMNIYIKEV